MKIKLIIRTKQNDSLFLLTELPSVAFKDLSQDQQTYIVLFLTHVIVAVWIFIYIYGADTGHW